jgi:N-acetylgalactosamine-6-sulfatase
MRAVRVTLVALFLIHSVNLLSAAQVNQPNIVFLFADDLGWGDLSCYGNQRIKTPELDQMAREGTLFTHFYVAGSVCSPSRSAIMTGQVPARNRIFGHLAQNEQNERRGMPNSLDPGLVMLTDLLKTKGYTTGHFGKWHLGNVSPKEYGVDVFRTNQISNTSKQDPVRIWEADARPTCTKDILDDALDFIKTNRAGPFYANVWFSDVHATLNPSEAQLQKTQKFHARGVDFYGVEQVYYAALLEMDQQIGHFIDALDALGLRENTLIIFSSDNGPEDYQISNSAHSGVGSPGPFRGRKRSIYEGGIRVPFILRWPGHVPAGKVNDTSVVNGVDFLPTLSSLAGAEVPRTLSLDGEDMHDVWLGSDRKRRRACFWEWRYRLFGHVYNHPPRLAVREGDFKLLMNPDQSRVELYHITHDPGERDNVASEHPERVRELREKLLKWNAELPESPVEPAAGKADWPWPEGLRP